MIIFQDFLGLLSKPQFSRVFQAWNPTLNSSTFQEIQDEKEPVYTLQDRKQWITLISGS